MFFSTKPATDKRFGRVSTLIVKVTHRCNLDCLYCYEHITKTGQDMSLETFKALADKALEHSESNEITFLFHGGEPTILPNEWYEQAINYAKTKALTLKKKANFSMQTNLISVSDSKIAMFGKYQIQLGVSFDGVAEDSMRGGENKVFLNYQKIRKAGIRAGILTTINQANYKKFTEICEFLTQKAGISHFKANVVTPVGRGFHLKALPAEQTFEAQQAILEYMIATDGKITEHNICTELERFFASDEQRNQMPKTLCHEKTCGAGEAVLGVTPNGDLLPCGRFQWNDEVYFLGNLDDKVSKQNHQNFVQEINKFQSLVPSSWYDCEGCEAKKVCTFGCQAFIVRSKEKANVDCLPTKMRFEYYKKNQDRLLPLYQKLKKDKETPKDTLTFRVGNQHYMVKN